MNCFKFNYLTFRMFRSINLLHYHAEYYKRNNSLCNNDHNMQIYSVNLHYTVLLTENLSELGLNENYQLYTATYFDHLCNISTKSAFWLL